MIGLLDMSLEDLGSGFFTDILDRVVYQLPSVLLADRMNGS